MHDFETAPETKSMLSGANGQLVIPGNENRVAILLSSPTGRTTFVAIGAAGNESVGVILPSGVTPLLLTSRWVGKGIKASIVLTDTAGAQQTYTWVEWIRGQ